MIYILLYNYIYTIIILLFCILIPLPLLMCAKMGVTIVTIVTTREKGSR